MSNTAPPSCDWIAAPTRLVGLRVSIQWSNSSFYSGKVTRYTPATGMHTIKYDDGEEKSYDMYHKSFRIEGNSFLWTPDHVRACLSKKDGHQNSAAVVGASEGTFPSSSSTANYNEYSTGPNYGSTYGSAYGNNNSFSSKAPPYLSRYPNSMTAVTFNVYVDTKMLQAGDRIVLCGSLKCMGLWVDPVELEPSDIDGTLWSRSLEVPLNMADTSTAGIMHFKYEIESIRDGRILEGQYERIETRMRRSYFHIFRPNYTHQRFRGCAHPSNAIAAEKYIDERLVRLRRGDFTFMKFMETYKDIMECIPNIQRAVIEGLFNEFLDTSETGVAGNLDYVLCFLGMIGYFGVTSAEKYYQNGGGYTTNAFLGYQQILVNRKPPKPSRWCHFLTDISLSDELLCVDNWQKKIGRYYSSLVGIAVQEAVERLSEHDGYKWLKLIPIVEHFDLKPRIVHPQSKLGREGFVTITADLCALVRDYQSIGNSLIVEQENNAQSIVFHRAESKSADNCDVGDVIGLGAFDFDQTFGSADSPPPPYQLTLARGWLRGLILYAPALSYLSFLFTESGMINIICEGIDVVDAFKERIEEEYWNSEALFDTMETLINEISQLKCPKIASAMLRNNTSEKIGRVLNFVAMCVRENLADAAPNAASAYLTLIEDSGVSGDWLDLSSAAKEFFRRHHAAEPDLEPEDTKNDKSWTHVWFNSSTVAKKKEFSQQELHDIRKRRMHDAFDTVSRFLEVPFFEKHPSGLFFEISRCWFFSGKSLNILAVLVDLSQVSQNVHPSHKNITGVFLSYHSSLSEYLSQYVIKVMKLAVDSAGGLSTLEFLTSSLPPKGDGSSYAHSIIYELLAYVTWGGIESRSVMENSLNIPLKSVLENHGMWIKTNVWCSNGSQSTLLMELLKKAKSILTIVKDQIFGDCISLQHLKIISSHERSLAELFDQFEIAKNRMEHLSLLEEIVIILNKLSIFESSIEHAQAYASFFCACGVKIDSDEIRQLINTLRSRYQNILSSEFTEALRPVIALPHLAWLYELRSSDLFLFHWREVGREVCIEVSEAAVAAPRSLSRHRVGGRGVNAAISSPHSNMLVELLDQVDFVGSDFDRGSEDNGSEEADPLPFLDGLDDQTASNMMAEYFQQQDALNDAVIKIDHVVLSQFQVAHILLPKVQRKWEELGYSILSRTISIIDLEKCFSSVGAVNINEELRLLSLNNFEGTGIANHDKSVLIFNAISDMNKFVFICKLRNWIPPLINLHKLLDSLCTSELEADELRSTLATVLTNIQSSWPSLTMCRMSSLVAGLSGLFEDYPTQHLNFLSCLGKCPDVTSWLLSQSSTEEFNRLLQVVRPCTDEPRLLSAIASLVHVRTLLLQPFFCCTPYENFSAFLDSFKFIDLGRVESGFDSEALWHLSNVASCFDGLIDVFERQTVSPGIKACYNLVEISERGQFVLVASSEPAHVLSLSLLNVQRRKNVSEDESEHCNSVLTDRRVESMEYLLDLRSKLMMTEVPSELENQLNASALIDAFVQQFQLLCEMKDVLIKLNNSGHISFQENAYERVFRFTLDGIDQLQDEYCKLVNELKDWGLLVKTACENHYYLNFFTMREILYLRKLVLLLKDNKMHDFVSLEKSDSLEHGTNLKPPPPTVVEPVPPAAPETPEIENMMSMGFTRDHAVAALSRCGDDISAAIDFVLSNMQYMDRIALEKVENKVPKPGDKLCVPDDSLAAIDCSVQNIQPVDEITGLLHLISSRLSSTMVADFIQLWGNRLSLCDICDNASFLTSLGEILGALFDSSMERAAAAIGRPLSLPSKKAMHRVDSLFHVTSESEEKQSDSFKKEQIKSVILSADLSTDSAKRIPVFVTCAESPEYVIDVALSVYVRRCRMPEPGEILFCTGDTTIEDLTLLLMRFIFAKNHGRGDCIFTVADLHKLSYALQCSFVEHLRSFLKDYSQECAGILLLISGLPRQVAMNSLSSQIIDLPPLELAELRRSIKESLSTHCGETVCIASVVNGGGKSHYIQSQVSYRQKSYDATDLRYRKIPIRESTDANKLLNLLSFIPRVTNGLETHFAFHIDIAHVIPEVSNTILFQLLYIGVIRDPKSSRCYFRNPKDIFYVEVPNSPSNKTAEALRFCCLLPTEVLHVTEDTLDFQKPMFADQLGTRIVTPEYVELSHVCKWLRALHSNKLKHGSASYDPDYSPYLDCEISAVECFTLLFDCCVTPEGPSLEPSWAVFHSFLVFMNTQFNCLQEYPLTQGGILASMQGLENFKEIFVALLIETSKDFSLRSVPQLSCVGPPPGSQYAISSDLENKRHKTPDSAKDLTESTFPPAPPSIRREKSSQYSQAEHRATQMDPPISIRQSSEEVVARFRNMTSWQQSEHPIVAFKVDDRDGGGISGVDILSLNKDFLRQHMPPGLIETLEANRFELDRDWSAITNEEGVAILRAVDGLGLQHRGGLRAVEAGYVMTVDNMLKMLSIQLRLRNNLPAIIMGETGCGKSTLIRNMCGILGVVLHTLNVHGGMEDDDIIDWMNSKMKLAQELSHDPSNRVVLFLDEINTCNCMGLFKEIVCDRSINGFPLLDNIKIIAACNPYRLRSTKSLYGGEEMAGLAFELFPGKHNGAGQRAENVGTGIKDPLRNLVYRVHPLPESMIDYIFDFGALSAETERLYIHAMLLEQLGIYGSGGEGVLKRPASSTGDTYAFSGGKAKDVSEEFIEVFTELVCTAQECVRHIAEGERSVTSLRDVSRCVKIFLWFAQHFADTKGPEEGWNIFELLTIRGAVVQKYIRKCVILSLAYCYHARLPRAERSVLVNSITSSWRRLQATGYQGYNSNRNFPQTSTFIDGFTLSRPKCPWLKLETNSFISVLEDTQREFVSVMNLGDGIALNEALCENLFMIMCSILNKIPIFVIGKPGSSKSLAMGLIQSNLNGDASEGAFLKSLPAVEVFSYQCSPLSTSVGIEQVFESSRRYLRQASNTVVVVLLDEVGLAEQSPHLPLKVLHKLLDEMLNGEAMVGISNWSLDPAKMNRAVHLYRPAPTIEDLSLTAEGMVRSANLKGYLQSLAKAYDETYRQQEHADFWGLREFYSTVRAINSSLAQQRVFLGTETVSLDGPTLINAVLRNYGGRPHEMRKIVNCFFTKLGLSLPDSWQGILIEQLIADNLKEPDARHLMLLTKSNAALSLLLDRDIVKRDRTEIIFGSDFVLDRTDIYIYLQLQRIKHCMAEGITIVLVHCEALYESLYDLLNQHYVEYGGQTYVRIAFGTYTKLCPIRRTFRVIVIVEKREAYTRLAPPLLNRFEKQVFERKDVLRGWHKEVLQKVQNFITLYCCKDCSKFDSAESYEVDTITLSSLRCAFCGFHADFLSSLILAAEHSTLATFMNDSTKYGVPGLKCRSLESLSTSDEEENMIKNYLENAVLRECIDRLLWLSPPEAVCRVHGISNGGIHKRLQKEFAIDVMSTYFMQQRHSSLASFASKFLFGNENHTGFNSLYNSDSWNDELGCQIIVVTHAPPNTQQAIIAIENCSTAVKSVTSIVLHELDQERELRDVVSDFFKNAISGSTLLVQCDPLAASKRRIEHTKFIIELARAKRLKHVVDDIFDTSHNKVHSDHEIIDGGEQKVMIDGTVVTKLPDNPSADISKNINRGIHVIMLIHLCRGDDAGGEGKYCVDFDTRWNYAFVDSISTAPGLPDIESMMGKSAVEIFDLFDAKDILSLAFRPSLSKLDYFYERTSEDLRNQILCVLQCLENSQFVDLILNVLRALIPQYTGEINETFEGGLGVSWLAGSIETMADKELQLAGTFQSALHGQVLDIASTLFAVILSHMLRNDTLMLFLESVKNLENYSADVSLWIYLFQISFNGSSLISLLKQKMENGRRSAVSLTSSVGSTWRKDVKLVSVKGDGMDGCLLASQFPFSFYVASIIDSMRKVCELLDETNLIRQFATTGLGMNLTANQDTLYISEYIYDFMSMKCRTVEGLPRDKQASLFEHILCIYKSSALSGNPIHEKDDRDIDQYVIFANGKSGQTDSNLDHLEYIAQVHWRYWRLERFFALFFDMINVTPLSQGAIFDYIMGLDVLNEEAYFGFLILAVKLLRPEQQHWRSDDKSFVPKYSSWVRVLPLFKTILLSMLDLLELPELLEEAIINEWNTIDFLGHFVCDCCIPLEMDPVRIASYSARFSDDIMFISPAGFDKILTLLSEIKRELDLGQQVPDDLICPITQLRFVYPVKAADGITYEMKAITDWMQKVMRSPMTNEPLRDAILTPDMRLIRRLGVIDTCDLNRVLDFFVFEQVLAAGPSHRKNVTPDMIRKLLELASGSYFLKMAPVSKFQSVDIAYKQENSVALSYAGFLSLFRELSKLSELSCSHIGAFGGCLGPTSGNFNSFSPVTQAIEMSIEKELQNNFVSCGHLDSLLSSVYVAVRDGIFTCSKETYDVVVSDYANYASLIETCISELGAVTTEKSASSRVLIDTIVHIRSLFKLTADCLCDATGSILSEEQINILCLAVNDYLSCHGRIGCRMGTKFLYNARMYFIKCIERKRGVSFLRSALMSSPVGDSPWITEWRKSGDVGFVRFIGSNKLPKWNPYTLFPLFTAVQEILAAFVSTRNLNEFSVLMQQILSDNDRYQVMSAFMLAGFHEFRMLVLLPATEQAGLDSISGALRQWIRELVPFSTLERRMIEFCVVGLPEQSDATFTEKGCRKLGELSEFSSSETVIMHRVVVHLVAISFCADRFHPFRFMKQLITDPASQIDSYFPTMPEDLTKMAQEAMGGRWYACPNGHPFYVDQCGRPTEVKTCVECGANIGGEDHELLDTNKDLGDAGTGYFKRSVLEDRSEKKYCIGSVEQEIRENKVFSARSLGPTAVRVIRLLMHSALFFGSYIACDDAWELSVRSILNSAYCSPSENMTTFFEEHVVADWNILTSILTVSIDDVSILLHGVLLRAMHIENVSFCERKSQTKREDPVAYDMLSTVSMRAEWEATVGTDFVGSIFSTTDVKQKSAEIYGLCCGQEDDTIGAFAYDLLEKISVETVPLQDRKLALPGLWLYTRHFSLDHFAMSLNMQAGAADRYPALTKFLEEEQQLRALKFMPSVFEWFRILKSKCTGNLDRETARKKTVADLLCEFDEVEKYKIEKVFMGFAAAWNESWHHVQKYGCIHFPADFNNVVMNLDVPLSFSLPNEHDEGNCPLALAQFLIDKHNAFVQVADVSRLLRDKRGASVSVMKSESRAEIISSRFLTSNHTIRYDLFEDLVPLFEKSCVTWNADGAGYDFAKAEALLVDRVLTGLPAIDFEQHGFQYMFEQHLRGGMTSLRTKLKQEPLSNESVDAIKRDISSTSAAYATLGFLEIVMSFLTATGGSFIESLDDSLGFMPLSTYVSTVLMMPDEISSRAVSQHVQLRHLESLWEMLSELTTCDIFSKVHAAYKCPLSARSSNFLLEALKNPEFDTETLLNVMKTFILDHLQDKVIDSKISVALCIGDCEVGDVYLSDSIWFTDHFPETLLMSEIVAAFRFLSSGGTDHEPVQL